MSRVTGIVLRFKGKMSRVEGDLLRVEGKG